jgi:uncharacterized membrane protein
MDIKSILATVAPWIGTALGGPLGGMAVTAAADALGLSDKTEAAIKQAISGATPEQMLMLKNADHDFALKMQALNFDTVEKIAALENADRDSARNREIQVKDRTPKILAYLITAGFFGMLTGLMFNTIPNDNRDIINVMLGTLGTAWIGVTGYYFGSTKGSEAKSALLANSTQNESKP